MRWWSFRSFKNCLRIEQTQRAPEGEQCEEADKGRGCRRKTPLPVHCNGGGGGRWLKAFWFWALWANDGLRGCGQRWFTRRATCDLQRLDNGDGLRISCSVTLGIGRRLGNSVTIAMGGTVLIDSSMALLPSLSVGMWPRWPLTVASARMRLGYFKWPTSDEIGIF